MKILNSIFIRIKTILVRLSNSTLLIFENTDTYFFVKMAVIWKKMNIKNSNIGDDINVYLLEELTQKKVLNYESFLHFNKENVLAIGSIIDWKCNKNSIIWGSGIMYGDFTKHYTPKKVCALRGKLSKAYLESFNVNCPDVFGDPALLLPLVYNPIIEKKYEIGFIPHYVDYYLPHVRQYREDHPNSLFIDLKNYDDWHQVINEILSCKIIFSSSLHGIIISDAYNVPNIYVLFSNKIAGGNIKYKDYYSGVNKEYKEPLDFRSSIDLVNVDHLKNNYHFEKYDATELLNVCPFKNKHFKNLNIQGGNVFYNPDLIDV